MEVDILIQLNITLGKLRTTKATHLWDDSTGTWRSFNQKLAHLRGIPEALAKLVLQFIVTLQASNRINNNQILDPALWTRSNDTPTNGGFTILNKMAYMLILGDSLEWHYLNNKWNKGDTKEQWRERWKKLWGSNLIRGLKSSYGKFL